MRGSCEYFDNFVLKSDHLSDLKILCNIRCVHLDLASNFAGTLLGITNCAANMMGVVAPAVAGYLTQVGSSDLLESSIELVVLSLYCL